MHTFWCVFAGHPDSRRQKTLMKTETFGNGFKSGFFWKNASFWCGKVKTEAFENDDKKINRCDCSHGGEIPGLPRFIVFGRFSVEKKTLRKRWCGQKYFASFSPVWEFWKRSSEFKALVQNAALIYFRPHYLRQIWAWPQYSLTFAGSPLPLFKRHRPQWR